MDVRVTVYFVLCIFHCPCHCLIADLVVLLCTVLCTVCTRPTWRTYYMCTVI